MVNTISIDKLINLYGIPELIKIVVKNAEYSVLKSLTIKTPLICFEWAIEIHNDILLCVEYLSNLGYSEFKHKLVSYKEGAWGV